MKDVISLALAVEIPDVPEVPGSPAAPEAPDVPPSAMIDHWAVDVVGVLPTLLLIKET